MHPRKLLAGLLGLAFAGLAHAFEFGHARLLSGVGQTLRADIPITQLSAQELAALQVRVAPEAAWRQAGLTPPVDWSSLQVRVVDGLTDNVRIARVTSDRVFVGTVADFLIDVQTVTGVQRHQVSVLVQRHALTLADGATDGVSDARPASITVRQGDTLFLIAQQHAVAGFTVYQMMAALLYANPRAFIDDNMNLVRAGAVLQRPDTATLSRLTDRQARLLFVQHARAYALRRGQGVAVVTPQRIADAVQAIISASPSDDAQAQRRQTQSPQDQLRLRVEGAGEGRTHAATAHVDVERTDGDDARTAVRDTLGRITQLQDNVQDLNQVLQELAQLDAARTGQANGTVARRDSAVAVTQSNNAQTTRTPVAEQDGVAAFVRSTQEQGGSAAVQDGAPSTQFAAPSAQQNPALASPSTLAVAPEAKTASAAPVPSTAVAPALFTPDVGRAGSAAAASVAPTQQTTPQTPGAGLLNTLWIMIAAGLALLLLLVVWLLRRARADANDGGKITDAMIQEKLNAIDLDLDQDDPPRRS